MKGNNQKIENIIDYLLEGKLIKIGGKKHVYNLSFLKPCKEFFVSYYDGKDVKFMSFLTDVELAYFLCEALPAKGGV